MLKKQCLFSNFSLGDNIVVSGLNGLGLIVLCLDELVLEFCDGFDTLVGEGDEASIEGLLLGQQSLDGGQVASVVVGADLSLFVCRGIKKKNGESERSFSRLKTVYKDPRSISVRECKAIKPA